MVVRGITRRQPAWENLPRRMAAAVFGGEGIQDFDIRVLISDYAAWSSLTATQSQFRRHNNVPSNHCLCFRLNQIPEPARDAHRETHDFTRSRRAENLHRAKRGEFQTRHWRNRRIALRHHAGQLRGGLDEQDTGEERVAWKM